MGCTNNKAAKVTANAQRPPPGDFSNINGNQQCKIFQPQFSLVQQQQMGQGQPFVNNPNQTVLPNNQNYQQQQQQLQQQKSPLKAQMKTTNRSSLRLQDEDEGEEDGEEDFEEEYEEDTQNNMTMRNTTKHKKTMRGTADGFKAAAQVQNTGQQQLSMKQQRDELDAKKQEFQQNLEGLKRDDPVISRNTGGSGSNDQHMIGMFRESMEKKNSLITKDDPIQKELSSAIDAYQKQIRDFKNSLIEMDKQLNGAGASPINNATTSKQYDLKLEQQPLRTGGLTLSSHMRSMGETGESGTYNNTMTQNTYRHKPMEEIYKSHNQSILRDTQQQQQQQQSLTQFQQQPSLVQYQQQPSVVMQQPVIKPSNIAQPIQKQDTQEFLPQRSRFDQSPTGQRHSPGRLYEDDDEELQQTHKYYNFDNGYQKSESAGGMFNKNYKIEQSSLNQINLKNNSQGFSMQTQQQQPVSDQAKDPISDQLHYKNVMNDKLNVDDLNRLKDQFLEQEEKDRLNPQNVLLRILFIHAFNDGTEQSNQEMSLDRRLYSFFINKNSNVVDVKKKIRKEFGFDVEQLHMYFRYQELQNIQYVINIDRFDIEEDIIICISLNAPKTHLKVILREPLDDIKIADVRFLNSRDRSEPALRQPDFPSLVDMNNFDVDQDKLPWPFYRDWTAEAAYLSDLIVKNKSQLLSDESQFAIQEGMQPHGEIHQAPSFAELVEAEAQYHKLSEEFKRASLYAVHLVVQKNPTPLNLFNLYGDDGDKFIVGGILIRRAKDWTICGHQLSEMSHMTTTVKGADNGTNQGGGESGSALIQISGKIATLDVRNMALLRNRFDRLVVPIACIVDYYGLKFETQSLSPISINSLVYGSDLDGLLFKDDDEEAEQMAKQIASHLNLKVHFIEEKATKKIKRLYLPYTVQLHRNKDMGESDKKFYLVNPFRLFPQDESVRQQSQKTSFLDLLSKQLRPELVINNNKNEPAPDLDYFTWKRPTRCDECGDYIQDYQYYYYEKRSVDKQQRLLVQYHCCVKCYNELLPTERFKVPVNKIVMKELPLKDRLEFWQDRNTGKRYYELQYRKIPLNSDAYLDFVNTKDKMERVSDQEEILRAGQKLKDEILMKLIEDLNNVEEDPLSPEQLELIMHSRGIPMRHLGKICTTAQLNHIREMAVIEVIARSAKILIKDGLTFLADDEEAGFKSDNIKKCVLHYLQEIFNMDEYQATSTQNIWDFITEHARKKFQVTIERDILKKIHLNTLLLSICTKLNIRLKKNIKDIDFYATPETGQAFLTIEDIESIAPVVKDFQEQMMCRIPLIAPQDKFPSSLNLILELARMKDSQGKRTNWYMIGGDERVEATELYRVAANVCEQVYGQQSLQYARVLKEYGEHLESRHQERGRPENSRWNRSFAIPEDELSMESRYYFQNALQVLVDIKQELSIDAAEIHIALARLFKPRAPQYSHYREKEGNVQDMYQSLANAIDIYETLLGFDHPETADANTKMALAYQEEGKFHAASPWIRRAFCVFFKSFGPHDAITLNCYEYLKAIETNIDSDIIHVPYEELPMAIFEKERQAQESGLGPVQVGTNGQLGLTLEQRQMLALSGGIKNAQNQPQRVSLFQDTNQRLMIRQ